MFFVFLSHPHVAAVLRGSGESFGLRFGVLLIALWSSELFCLSSRPPVFHKFFIGISCGILVSWMSAFLFRIVGVHPPHAHVVTAERPESELEPPALPESTFDMETSRDQNYKTVEQKETDKVRVWPVLPTNFSPT